MTIAAFAAFAFALAVAAAIPGPGIAAQRGQCQFPAGVGADHDWRGVCRVVVDLSGPCGNSERNNEKPERASHAEPGRGTGDGGNGGFCAGKGLRSATARNGLSGGNEHLDLQRLGQTLNPAFND